MPDWRVVFDCSNVANVAKGISLQLIPFFNDERSEAKRRRKRWVDFVKVTRDKWVPTKNIRLCARSTLLHAWQKCMQNRQYAICISSGYSSENIQYWLPR